MQRVRGNRAFQGTLVHANVYKADKHYCCREPKCDYNKLTVRMAVGVVITYTSVVLPPTTCFKVISSDFSDHDGAPNIAVGAREEFIAKNG